MEARDKQLLEKMVQERSLEIKHPQMYYSDNHLSLRSTPAAKQVVHDDLLRLYDIQLRSLILSVFCSIQSLVRWV